MSELVVAESKGLSREIRTKVTLFPSGLFPVGPVEPVVCDAIWDTGAYGSSISERAAKALDLIPVSSTVVHTANGDRQTPVYQIDLMLPSTSCRTRSKKLRNSACPILTIALRG